MLGGEEGEYGFVDDVDDAIDSGFLIDRCKLSRFVEGGMVGLSRQDCADGNFLYILFGC